ncbi:hypothetical protein [Mesorhizobium sp. M0633]|uniref:hypothetical protein n=1 Tax=Mesorhizobium sp. M0633 TaxID=2956977 RepID=UPI003334C5F2
MSPRTLAFVGRYPTPDNASRLGEKRLASFMAQDACCGRRQGWPVTPRPTPKASSVAGLRGAAYGFGWTSRGAERGRRLVAPARDDRVMQGGDIIEEAPPEQSFTSAQNDRTKQVSRSLGY